MVLGPLVYIHLGLLADSPYVLQNFFMFILKVLLLTRMNIGCSVMVSVSDGKDLCIIVSSTAFSIQIVHLNDVLVSRRSILVMSIWVRMMILQWSIGFHRLCRLEAG